MDPRIKQIKRQGPSPAELLAKVPRRPMSIEQQAVALEKVQQQATQRVKLGQQLFEAADARLKQHQQVLDEINDQQRILREQVQEDVAKSLQTYDQWMGRIDESFTKSIRDMTHRLDQLEERVGSSHNEMQDMLAKAAALLGQTQNLLAETFDDQDGMIQAMQASATEAHDCDLDEFVESVQPGFDSQPDAQAETKRPRPDHDDDVIEVEIVAPIDESGMPQEPGAPEQPTSDGDDVFGQVLRRLRSQDEGGSDGHAAA